MRKERGGPVSPSIAQSLINDPLYRTRVFLYLGLIVNLIYGGMMLISGGRSHTFHTAVLGVYYMVLAVMRFTVLELARRQPFGTNLPLELRRYRLCGLILLGMNLVLAILVTAFIKQEVRVERSLFRVILTAAYAFYTLILAIVNVVRFRRYGSPLLSAAKAISLTAALVTMLSLEVTMIDSLTTVTAERFRITTLAITGAVVCLVVLGMAVYMVAYGTMHLRKISEIRSGYDAAEKP